MTFFLLLFRTLKCIMAHLVTLLGVDIMVVAGGIKPPRVTLTRIEYSGKQEETLKH
jgi:hypothetical protein